MIHFLNAREFKYKAETMDFRAYASKTDKRPESKFDIQMRLFYFEVSNFKTGIKCIIKF